MFAPALLLAEASNAEVHAFYIALVTCVIGLVPVALWLGARWFRRSGAGVTITNLFQVAVHFSSSTPLPTIDCQRGTASRADSTAQLDMPSKLPVPPQRGGIVPAPAPVCVSSRELFASGQRSSRGLWYRVGFAIALSLVLTVLIGRACWRSHRAMFLATPSKVEVRVELLGYSPGRATVTFGEERFVMSLRGCRPSTPRSRTISAASEENSLRPSARPISSQHPRLTTTFQMSKGNATHAVNRGREPTSLAHVNAVAVGVVFSSPGAAEAVKPPTSRSSR